MYNNEVQHPNKRRAHPEQFYTKLIIFERRSEKLTMKISRQENEAAPKKLVEGQLALPSCLRQARLDENS